MTNAAVTEVGVKKNACIWKRRETGARRDVHRLLLGTNRVTVEAEAKTSERMGNGTEIK